MVGRSREALDQPDLPQIIDGLVALQLYAFRVGVDAMVSALNEVQKVARLRLEQRDADEDESPPPEWPPSVGSSDAETFWRDDMDTSYAVSDDRDLGGDDLKLVEYRIYFDKFDQEAFLRDGKELLNYRSTEADFGGRVIADFLHEVSPNGRPGKEEEVKWAELPYAWRVKKHEMFPTVQSLWDTNRKYLRMTYRVIDRWPRQDREYDKSMSESLAQIALNTTPREHSERERAEKERDNKDRK